MAGLVQYLLSNTGCLNLLFQAAAGSDVGNLPESSTSRPAIDLTAPASDQPSVPPSTAGDALLAAQLQEEDQVATQTACNLCTKFGTEQQNSRSVDFVAPDLCLHCMHSAFGLRHLQSACMLDKPYLWNAGRYKAG